MKRLHCPKCDEPILFDDSLYQPGRTLVFECPSCRKQFKIRVGMGVKPSAEGSLQNEGEEREEKEPVGYLVTGTFVMNELVGVKERVNLSEGAIITLGASTLILYIGAPETDEN